MMKYKEIKVAIEVPEGRFCREGQCACSHLECTATTARCRIARHLIGGGSDGDISDLYRPNEALVLKPMWCRLA